MLNEKQLNWFETLTQLDGVSGHEHQVAQYLFNEYSNYTDEILRDNLGSILAVRRSNKKNCT
ncbi:glutamyl aminopeptidase [Erysipelothrix rhusiopathiae SY1027]|uniref:glutamyl aminopeptidase n=1 Tax=Erysipelothrix rhusiopathiae TaxID=1648 RepID=UPI00033484CE|nr:glutamyl aminopeptidase [Erysipelothrix rhusiopathiae]AGN23789.1 glutamyl aminopeptidase [Erysipelothrix rhusiopathiae SY1027]